MKRTANINIAVMENEKDAHDWALNDLAVELYWWCDFFNIAFFKDQKVPIPAISFQNTNAKTLGHYVIGRNAFGFMDNININKKNLARPLWDILATLLHEMLHSWEYVYLEEKDRTKNWYHTKPFRLKLAEFGIYCDNRGCHQGVGGKFVHLLRQHAVRFVQQIDLSGIIPITHKPKKPGKSKLKKWTCGCTNVRVAISDFRAKCLKCDNEFEFV